MKNKILTLTLISIKYTGDSIGDDIRVEVEILGKTLSIDKTIRTGATMEANREIGVFEINKEVFEANVKITITEKDALFKDIGKSAEKIKIETRGKPTQLFIYKIEARETRSILGIFWGTKKAIFEIGLKVDIGNIERYTPETEDGWFITLDEKDKGISLPAHIKVNPKYIKNGREYFVPLEGENREKLLSVKLQDDGSSYLIFGVQHEPMANAAYSISKKIFTINGKKYNAIDYPDAPWIKGTYNIEIPDFPHGNNNSYTEAKRQKVWFKIDFGEARYLHVGARSLGCMTITETARWMEIYNAIIKARKGDLKSVGVINIVD